jgi:hypothetical protein
MQLKPRPAWSGCWIALVSPDQPGWDGLYLNCKGSMLNVQNPFDTPGFLRKIWVTGSYFSTNIVLAPVVYGLGWLPPYSTGCRFFAPETSTTTVFSREASPLDSGQASKL